MIEFVPDDGGRLNAGFRGQSGDCLCRAAAIASGYPYREVYDLINQFAAQESSRLSRSCQTKRRSSARDGVCVDTAKRVLSDLGFEWVPCMGIGTGCSVHMRADELPAGRIVVRLSKHYAALIDGVLHDTFDSSRGGTRCIYGYWKPRKVVESTPSITCAFCGGVTIATASQLVYPQPRADGNAHACYVRVGPNGQWEIGCGWQLPILESRREAMRSMIGTKAANA